MSTDTGFKDNRDHAPIDSEIYALFDSIGASWSIESGIVTVTTKDGEIWDFTEPKRLQGCDFPTKDPINFPDDPVPKLVTCNRCGWVHTAMTREKAQASVDEFNNWFAKQPVETKEMYGNNPSSMDDYDRCFACGFGATFRPFKPGDCPDGCTIQPTVYEEEDDGTKR